MIDDFNTFELFFKGDVPGEGVAKDLAVTLNIQNLLDKDPLEFRGGSQIAGMLGISSGRTIGRLVTSGVSRKF